MKNTLVDWLVLFFSTGMGVIAQLVLKQWISSLDVEKLIQEPLTGLFLILGNGYFWAYGGAAVTGVLSWFWVIRRFNLGVAYPISESLAFVLILITSSWFFSEPMSPSRWVGIALISAGLCLCR